MARLQNFPLVVAYLQFQFKSAFQPKSVIPAVTEIFFFCDCEFWPLPLTFQHNLEHSCCIQSKWTHLWGKASFLTILKTFTASANV